MVVFLRISFLGSEFYGTQKQPDKKTIQGIFESLLSRIYAKEVKVTICSRLDRGVHALDYALSFTKPDERISLDHLSYCLRRGLEHDSVVLKDIREIKDEEFSARYSCDYKRYLYLIQNKEKQNPLFDPISYHPKKVLDLNKIKEALALFEGQHDFRFFATPEGEENTVLILDKVSMEEKEGFLYLRFQGRNFLRYQVRFMVGAALLHAEDKLSLSTISELLSGKDILYPKKKAEPQGLILETIHYPQFDSQKKDDFFVLSSTL